MTNRLNAAEAKRNKREFFIMFAIVFVVSTLYLTLIVSSYQASVAKAPDSFFAAIGPALDDVEENPIHLVTFAFDKEHTPTAFGLCAMIDMIVIALLWLDQVRHHHDLAGIESGSAKIEDDYKGFAKKYSNTEDDKNSLLSQRVWLDMNTRHTLRNNNILVVGGSGAGKTRFFVKPNLLQRNCNYVITDPSGELLESVGHLLREDGYDVKVFNLVERTKSNCYNPFHYIRDDFGVIMMINCLIKNTTPPEQHSGDPFWEKSEVMLLSAMCFYLRDYRPESEQNFATVLRLLRWAEVDEKNPDKASPLDRLFLKQKGNSSRRDTGIISRGRAVPDSDASDDERVREWTKRTIYTDENGNLVSDVEFKSIEELDTTGNSIAVKYYKDYKQAAGKTAKSIIVSCDARLQTFNVDDIDNLTSKDDIHLEELGGPPTKDDFANSSVNNKQALFVIIPAADSTANFLVSMMYSQLFETLYFIAETKCKGKRLGRHVRFLLDEFANIGTIPEFTKKLATMRKYEISCSVILQNLAQIKTMYKDDWESIVGNSDSFIFLGGKEFTTLEYLSKELGTQTITTKSRSMSVGKNGSTSQSYQQTSRPLLTPEELGNLPNEKCVVMIRGLDPFLDDKYDYTKHKAYSLTADGNDKLLYINTLNNNIPSADEVEEAAAELDASEVIKSYATVDELISANPEWSGYPDIYAKFIKVPGTYSVKQYNEIRDFDGGSGKAETEVSEFPVDDSVPMPIEEEINDTDISITIAELQEENESEDSSEPDEKYTGRAEDEQKEKKITMKVNGNKYNPWADEDDNENDTEDDGNKGTTEIHH